MQLIGPMGPKYAKSLLFNSYVSLGCFLADVTFYSDDDAAGPQYSKINNQIRK